MPTNPLAEAQEIAAARVRARTPPPDNTWVRERIAALLDGLAGQQAMADDSWRCEWEVIAADLATLQTALSEAQQEIARLTADFGAYKAAIRDACGLISSERNRWESATDKRTFLHWEAVAIKLNALLLVLAVREDMALAAPPSPETRTEGQS